MNEKEVKHEQTTPSKSTQSTPSTVTSKDQQKTAERNLSYDISDEKLLTAAAQLVDVYNKRSKAAATITVKKPTAEPRNRNLNLNKPTRPPFVVPNFVVTKITEKSRTPEKSIFVRQTKGSHGGNMVKAIQKQEELEQTKRMIEMQRQKSLNIFNANEDRKTSRVLFDAKEFRVKSLSVLNKSAGNTSTSEYTERIEPTTIKPRAFGGMQTTKSSHNEPVILNFRTKMHNSTSKPRQYDTPVTINGRNNANTYRVLEISPVSKNSIDRSIPKTADRYYSNKLHSSSVARSVRPVSMPVTKVYSRFNANSSRSPYQSRILYQRTRAPIVKKFPSMPDLSKVNKIQTNFLGQKSTDDSSVSNPSTSLTRYKSSIVCGTTSSAKLFDETIRSNEEYSKLYNLCSDVVSKSCFKGQTVRRKRGRPKKRVYNSLTRDLLASAEFSLKADILKLNEMYYAAKRFGGQTMFNPNPRRSKRFALLSIEPVLPDLEPLFNRTRDRSPVNSFHVNRTPLKTYSRANLIQPRVTLDNKKLETYTSRPQIQLLNIEPLSSTSHIDQNDNTKDEVTQSTEYIIDTGLSNDDLDESDAIYIEYLEDNDEIESPAYEPLVSAIEPGVKSPSIITEEADTTVESGSQWDQIRRLKKPLNITPTTSVNVKRSPNIEIKYMKTSESDAHSTTDSIAELFTVFEIEEKTQFMQASSSAQHKPDVNISPIRKSTRKRKIPSEFPNFAKKIRG